jgi:hypothetical protein
MISSRTSYLHAQKVKWRASPVVPIASGVHRQQWHPSPVACIASEKIRSYVMQHLV